MKKTVFTYILLASSISMATDWSDLIFQAPHAKKETINIDKKGLIQAVVARLPDGKSRIISFTSFSSEKNPVLNLGFAADDELNEKCEKALRLNKPFKAQLTIQTNPLATNSFPLFGSPAKSFENPFRVGFGKVIFGKQMPHWSRYDQNALKNAQGRQIADYYEDLLNEKIEQSSDGVVQLDLSNMNGLACDLASGNMTFLVTRDLEYEAGLPVKESWLGLEQYASIFQSFWKTQPRIVDSKQTTQQNEIAEALLLGMATSKANVDESLLKSPYRIQRFLASVKSEVKGLNATQKASVKSSEVADNWMMNVEYKAPEKLITQQTVLVSDSQVFKKYED